MTVNEFLKKYYNVHYIRPHAICKDGYKLSIQASPVHHCCVSDKSSDEYSHVEVKLYDGTSAKEIARLAKHSYGYDNQDLVFDNVDVEFLDYYLTSVHGGIIGSEIDKTWELIQKSMQ
jgi:hypothetical protein